MTRFSIALVLVFLFIYSFSFMACQQERQPCLQPKYQSLIMGAYHAGDTNGVVTITSLTLADPLIGTINSVDTFALYHGILAQGHSFSLLLSILSDSCQYYIQRDTTVAAQRDTISFYYQRQLHFLSNACGYTYFFNLQNVNCTHHNLDSVIVENNNITTNVNIEHLKVYFMEL